MSLYAHRVSQCLALLCLSLLTGCDDQSGTSGILVVDGYRFNFKGERATRTEGGIIPATAGTIIVDNRFGAVEIATGDADEEPRWQWEISCWAGSVAEATEYTRQITCEVDSNNGEYRWKLEIPKTPGESLTGVRSNVALLVPANVEVQLINAYGDSNIHGIQGGTQARCQFGNLGLFELEGQVDASLKHGDLTVTKLSDCVLANMQGDVVVTDVSGELKVTSSHGDVILTGLEQGAKVEHSFGNVNVVRVQENLFVRTEHAAVHVEDAQGDLDLKTTFGKLEVKQAAGLLMLRNEFGDVIVDGGSRVDAATKFGDLKVATTAAEVRCHTEHGKISIHCQGTSLQNVYAQGSFGDLKLRVPAGVQPTVEAAVEFGKIKSPFAVLPLEKGVDNFADLPDGAPRISLQASHGDIQIEQ